METDAPDTSDPFGVRITPLMEEVVSWANVGNAKSAKAKLPRNSFLKTIVFSLLLFVD
jgi:hypothetical protein